MNIFSISGRVWKVPKTRIININGKSITVCNFTVAIIDDTCEKGVDDDKYVDFVECICFNDLALSFSERFVKGSKILCSGRLKNHFFEDYNRTKHFTQILLVSFFEFGDSSKSLVGNVDPEQSSDSCFLPEVNNVLNLYSLLCEHGYLCIDEEDYYSIAMSCCI